MSSPKSKKKLSLEKKHKAEIKKINKTFRDLQVQLFKNLEKGKKSKFPKIRKGLTIARMFSSPVEAKYREGFGYIKEELKNLQRKKERKEKQEEIKKKVEKAKTKYAVRSRLKTGGGVRPAKYKV
jgi:hypothetical protein